jgi:hypothetical protein
MRYNQIIFLITFTGSLIFSNPIFSQGKFEMSVGFGIPNWLNIGLNFGSKIKVGSSIGFLQMPDKYIYKSVSLNIYYHFSGKSNFSTQSPWYINGGIGYQNSYDKDRINHSNDEKSYFIYPRIGRTFSLSKKTGFNFDVGVFFTAIYYNNSFDGLRMRNGFEFDDSIMPSGSISFFFRL